MFYDCFSIIGYYIAFSVFFLCISGSGSPEIHVVTIHPKNQIGAYFLNIIYPSLICLVITAVSRYLELRFS